jgi:hypothetical protein
LTLPVDQPAEVVAAEVMTVPRCCSMVEAVAKRSSPDRLVAMKGHRESPACRGGPERCASMGPHAAA